MTDEEHLSNILGWEVIEILDVRAKNITQTEISEAHIAIVLGYSIINPLLYGIWIGNRRYNKHQKLSLFSAVSTDKFLKKDEIKIEDESGEEWIIPKQTYENIDLEVVLARYKAKKES